MAAGVAAVGLLYAAALSWGQSELQERGRPLRGETRFLEGEVREVGGSVRSLDDAVRDLRGEARHLRSRVIVGPSPPRPDRPWERITVRFEFDRFLLKSRARVRLAIFGRTLDSSAVVSIDVRGHTDWIGGEGYNEWLSIRRAETVCHELRRLLGPKARCEPLGLGEGEPVAPNCMSDGRDNPGGRARNRRVDVTVRQRGRTSASPNSTPGRVRATTSQGPTPRRC